MQSYFTYLWWTNGCGIFLLVFVLVFSGWWEPQATDDLVSLWLFPSSWFGFCVGLFFTLSSPNWHGNLIWLISLGKWATSIFCLVWERKDSWETRTEMMQSLILGFHCNHLLVKSMGGVYIKLWFLSKIFYIFVSCYFYVFFYGKYPVSDIQCCCILSCL